jgi:two-component system CheB/CheR fusion protein
MAAKNKTTRRAKAPESPQPAQQPTGAGEQAGEVPAPPGDAGPAEGRPQRPGPPVAGIGASAGSLDAFKRFFAAMPPDSGIAFVLVPHLDPARESLMVELLARHTALPVVEAQDGTPVEANRVYVLPPNKYMTIGGGALRLTGPVERHAAQTSIDLFLRSLADDQQERSVCITLSGTGSHGALGLRAVKAAGGLAMVQDPATAEYERMPRRRQGPGVVNDLAADLAGAAVEQRQPRLWQHAGERLPGQVGDDLAVGQGAVDGQIACRKARGSGRGMRAPHG